MEYISIEDFKKIQMKSGTILSAEKLENADKLLVLSIDVGEESPRTILSGIAEFVDSEDLIGTRCVVVTNLQPRKMRGHESNGMVVAILSETEDGEETFSLVASKDEMPNGSLLS